ncbi:MAG: tRNA pseudouridine(38-40) synthase TruA [Campylobacterales bacterium]|nr:tRNA pseudouridine(38-40) synthase TruA [Campylobacterales bacterium]
MRVKAVISYDGSFYQGFQRQKITSQTVTGQIEEVLYSLGIISPIVGSGRTDTGVHASGQVIHFDLPDFWKDLKKLNNEINRKLTHIRFKHLTAVPDSFHARFSAKKRLYRYVFKTSCPSVFENNYVSYYLPFDQQILIEALRCFEGEHDFQYFQKTGTDTHTTIRHVYHTEYKQFRSYHIIYFEANGFLRSQVRMMIDAAMACATGKLSLPSLKEQVACKKRHITTLAPPHGLYLARILY